jgi:hypothetical protein
VSVRVWSVIPAGVVVAALSLSACAPFASSSTGPGGGLTHEPGVSASAAPSPSPTPTEDLGLVRVSARATATDNGAALDLELVVRQVLPAGSPQLAEIWAEVDRRCSTATAPADYRNGPVTVIEGTVEQVPGTPAWPADQWLYWMTLDVSTLAIGDGFAQGTVTTKKFGTLINCEGSAWAVGSGTSTLYYWSAASQSLAGPDVEKTLAMNEYAWFTGFGDPHSRSTLSDCVIEVPATTSARVEAAGYHWVEYAETPDWAPGQACGVGVDDSAFGEAP